MLATHGIEPIGVIHEDSNIGNAWLTGTPIDVASKSSGMEAIVHSLEKAAMETANTT